ncbi:hypothetical protein RUND412_010053 [Rhizina undulata]
MCSKGSPCSKDRPEIYPQFLFPLSPTYNVWAKLTAADIHGKLEQREGFGGQNVWFWDNHPIRWVRVVGVVIKFEDYEKRVLITVDDGSGHLLKLISWKTVLPDFRRAPADLTGVTPNSVIKAMGTIDKYQDMKQLKLIAVTVLKSTNEEEAARKSMTEFKKNILLKPWIVPQDVIEREEKRSLMGLQEGNPEREDKRKRGEDDDVREQRELREAEKEELQEMKKQLIGRRRNINQEGMDPEVAKEEVEQAQETQKRRIGHMRNTNQEGMDREAAKEEMAQAQESQKRLVGRRKTISHGGIDRVTKRLNVYGFPIEIEEIMMREQREREIASSSSKGIEKSEYTVPGNSSSGNASRGLETLKQVSTSLLVDDAKPPTKPLSSPFVYVPPKPPESDHEHPHLLLSRPKTNETSTFRGRRHSVGYKPPQAPPSVSTADIIHRTAISALVQDFIRANPPGTYQPHEAWKRRPNFSFPLPLPQSALPSLQPPANLLGPPKTPPPKTPTQTYTFRSRHQTEPSPPPPHKIHKVHYSPRTLKLYVQSYLSCYNHTRPTLDLLRSNPSIKDFAQHVIEALPPCAIPLIKRMDDLLTSTLQTLVAEGVLLPPEENSSEYELVEIANLKPFIVEAVNKAKRTDGRIVAKEVWEMAKRNGGRWAEIGKDVVADAVAEFLDSSGGWRKIGSHVWVWEGRGLES